MADKEEEKTSIKVARIAFWGGIITAVLALFGVVIQALLAFPPVRKLF
ncbi:MAG TPA: hypothetical protein VMT73_00490 [Anaerolineales bacterium]|nr:hypothetical protein [Anaerolineales bacterium]